MNVWTSAVSLAVRIAEEVEAEDTVFDPDKVSPGVEGFIMTGVLALAVIGLGFVLVRRMRNSAYRHEVREQIDAELAEKKDAKDAGAAGAAGAAAASVSVDSGAVPDRGAGSSDASDASGDAASGGDSGGGDGGSGD